MTLTTLFHLVMFAWCAGVLVFCGVLGLTVEEPRVRNSYTLGAALALCGLTYYVWALSHR